MPQTQYDPSGPTPQHQESQPVIIPQMTSNAPSDRGRDLPKNWIARVVDGASGSGHVVAIGSVWTQLIPASLPSENSARTRTWEEVVNG